MPTVITDEIPISHRYISLTESNSGGVDADPFAREVVDITDMCARKGQFLIKYGGIDVHDSIIQIQDRPTPGVDVGINLNFIFQNDDQHGHKVEELAHDPELKKKAQFLGCDVVELAEVILHYLPSMQPEQV